jgi:predicted nucleotidyltransferase
MKSHIQTDLVELPEATRILLHDLVDAARKSFQEDLKSIVLFGSAAEGRLRPVSDLNLVFVLRRFERNRVDAFRKPLRLAHVAGRASVMFLLESELAAAAGAFAVKFDDIVRRHTVLFGEDVFEKLVVPRAVIKQQLGQVLLNLSLRLRERYAVTSLREEQLTMVIAEAAGPIRAAAATLCQLEGRPMRSPREALETIAAELPGGSWKEVLEMISLARQAGSLPAGLAPEVVFQMIVLSEAMRIRTEKLP